MSGNIGNLEDRPQVLTGATALSRPIQIARLIENQPRPWASSVVAALETVEQASNRVALGVVSTT